MGAGNSSRNRIGGSVAAHGCIRIDGRQTQGFTMEPDGAQVNQIIPKYMTQSRQGRHSKSMRVVSVDRKSIRVAFHAPIPQINGTLLAHTYDR